MTRIKILVCYSLIALAMILGEMELIKGTGTAQSKRSIPAQQALDDSPRRAAEAISKSVDHGDVLKLAQCEIRSAFWGGYDVEVRVAARTTTDQKPRSFRVSKGKFIESIDKIGIRELASFKRQGLVQVKSREEAFKKGIPFYIYDVAVDASGSLVFAVVSNPNVSTDYALERLQWVSRSAGWVSRLEVWGRSLSSSPQPQKRVWQVGVTKETVLSLVTRFADYNSCLCSNEVSLESIASRWGPNPP